MNDPRFFFPSTPGSGSIMYYSTVYNKWTGSDTTKFAWNEPASLLTLKGILRLTDIINATKYYDIKSISDVLSISYNTPSLSGIFLTYTPIDDYVNVNNLDIGAGNIRMTDGGGNLLLMNYDPMAGGFVIQPPSATSQFLWTPTGFLSTVGSNAALKLGDRITLTNYYTLFSSGNILTLQYNGADTGTTFLTNGNMTSKGYRITDLTVPTDFYRLLAYSGLLRVQFNNAETGISFDPLGIVNAPRVDFLDGANEFQVYHSGGDLIFNNAFSAVAVPLVVNGDGDGVLAYNIRARPYTPTTYIELDTASIRATDGFAVLAENNTTNDYLALATRATNVWTIPVRRGNPNQRQLTLSTSINSSGTIVIGAGAVFTNEPFITFTSLTVSATRNGSAYTAFQAIPSRPVGTVYSYDFTATSNWLIVQPITQLAITWIPNNGTQIDEDYVFTITAVLTKTNFVGMTWGVGSVDYSTTIFNASYTRSSGSGTCTLSSANPLTTTAATLTKDLPPNVGFTTLACDFLCARYLNLVFTQTFTGSSTTCLNCFRNGYLSYDIELRVSTGPAAAGTMYLQLATSLGVESVANYNGRISTLGAAYTSAAYTTTAGFTLGTTIASVNNIMYNWRISNPNVGRFTTLTGTNLGTGYVPETTAGLHNSAISYPSFTFIHSGTITGSFTITGVYA
jgi:hypothetical protein